MLIPIGFLFFGCLCLGYGFTLQRNRSKVLQWPQTTARIIDRQVRLSNRAGRTSVPGFRYESLVKYLYWVHDVQYEGDKLYKLGWVTNSYKDRKRFLDKMPDNPEVRYDPDNPSDSCLFPADRLSIFLGYGLGAALVIFGLGLLLGKL